MRLTRVVRAGMAGQDAAMGNYLLMGHNIFHKSTLSSKKRHYTFTAESALAAKDMKWFLGYRLKDCTREFGENLRAFLTGDKKLTYLMQLRRWRRGFRKSKPMKPHVGLPVTPARRGYVFPVAAGRRWMKIGFPGQGTHSFTAPPNNWQSDNAVDIWMHEGTPLVAVTDGRIGSRLGSLGEGGRFAGLRLYLEANDGNQFYYAHLQKIVVKPGDHVRKGDLLGYSGSANGVPHLHLGMQNGNPANTFF